MAYFEIQKAKTDEVESKVPPSYSDEVCLMEFKSKPDSVYIATTSGLVIENLEKSYKLKKLEKRPQKLFDEDPSKVKGNERLIKRE
ncbi:MAG: hypothetical protein ACNS60_08190 [Candidatus Cyclobacteriaceae bacterium M2_1C_046]